MVGRMGIVLKGVCSGRFWLAGPSLTIVVARLQRKATFSGRSMSHEHFNHTEGLFSSSWRLHYRFRSQGEVRKDAESIYTVNENGIDE